MTSGGRPQQRGCLLEQKVEVLHHQQHRHQETEFPPFRPADETQGLPAAAGETPAKGLVELAEAVAEAVVVVAGMSQLSFFAATSAAEANDAVIRRMPQEEGEHHTDGLQAVGVWMVSLLAFLLWAHPHHLRHYQWYERYWEQSSFVSEAWGLPS